MTQVWLSVRFWATLIDIFDLFWHSAPPVLLGLKVGRMTGRKRERG